MSDQQRPDPPPEGQEHPAPQPAPEPPPWPTLGADWKEAAEQSRTQTAPPPGPASWQPPPQQQWGQPPVQAPWHDASGRYPGARIPDAEARNWAVAAHLSPLLAMWLGGLSFLGPLLVWLFKRDDHPYVAEQGREALNFNLSFLIYLVGSIITIIGLVATPVIVVTWFVLMIIGAVKAANGEPYRYPFTMRMVK